MPAQKRSFRFTFARGDELLSWSYNRQEVPVGQPGVSHETEAGRELDEQCLSLQLRGYYIYVPGTVKGIDEAVLRPVSFVIQLARE